MAKGLGYVETGQKEGDGGGEDSEVIGERKPFGAYNRPEFAEEELKTKDEEEGGKRAPLFNPLLIQILWLVAAERTGTTQTFERRASSI